MNEIRTKQYIIFMMKIVLKGVFLYKTSLWIRYNERKRLTKKVKDEKKKIRVERSHLTVEEPIKKQVEPLLEELQK
jgi:hypothetical protein